MFSRLRAITLSSMLLVSMALRAQEGLIERGFVLSAQSGALVMTGEFSNYYSGVGAGFTGSVARPLPFFLPDFIMGDFTFQYAPFGHDNSIGSQLAMAQISLGPLFYYEFSSWFKPYLKVVPTFSYVNASGIRNDTILTAWKFGFMAALGNQFYIGKGFGVRLEVSDWYMPVENSTVNFLAISLAATYDFGAAQTEQILKKAEETREQKEHRFGELFKSGVQAIKESDARAARQALQEALILRPDHSPTQENLKKLEGLEQTLIAEKYRNENQPYRAIRFLIKAKKSYAPAKPILLSLRKQLAREAVRLRNKGERQFSRGKYKACINNMKKALLVNPDDETAQVYLNRARKRAQALEKLR